MNPNTTPPVVTLFSFGYKYGSPQDVNLLFDVRFLQNPFHIPKLRSHNGTEQCIADFVLRNEEGGRCLDQLKQTISYYLSLFQQTGKDTLRVGIGCTGGHHRSVAVTEALTTFFKTQQPTVHCFHRDIAKESH